MIICAPGLRSSALTGANLIQPLGSFALDKITEDFVQTEATKFFALVASEIV
jgi:hypothetical protein